MVNRYRYGHQSCFLLPACSFANRRVPPGASEMTPNLYFSSSQVTIPGVATGLANYGKILTEKRAQNGHSLSGNGAFFTPCKGVIFLHRLTLNSLYKSIN